jgi:hypothetical protein
MISRRVNQEEVMLAEAKLRPVTGFEAAVRAQGRLAEPFDLTMWVTTPRRLGDELIDAARNVVAAIHIPDLRKRNRALIETIRRLEELVGQP